MKTIEYREYNDLSDSEKESAVNHFFLRALQTAVEFANYYEFDPDLYEKIRKAHKKANKSQTPWFVHEFISEDCGNELRELALDDAEQALYEPCDQSFDIVTVYELEKAGE